VLLVVVVVVVMVGVEALRVPWLSMAAVEVVVVLA
jgi:hypothetical protein